MEDREQEGDRERVEGTERVEDRERVEASDCGCRERGERREPAEDERRPSPVPGRAAKRRGDYNGGREAEWRHEQWQGKAAGTRPDRLSFFQHWAACGGVGGPPELALGGVLGGAGAVHTE